MNSKIKQAILVVLVILLGIFIGFQYEKKSSIDPIIDVTQETLKFKQLHKPQYLSEQIINYKAEYIENRPTPTNEEEEIIAYYEDFYFHRYDKNPEVYEENGTVYINLDGKVKAIASHDENETIPMLPTLSASKEFISYTWCNPKTNSCDVIVKNLITNKEIILDDAGSVTWHPTRDILVYDVSVVGKKGYNFSKSEVYIYYVRGNNQIQLTDTSDFVEMNPIFSKDGNSIYCDDEKTNRLVYFKLWNARGTIVSSLKFYKTSDSSLDIENIKEQSNLFKTIPKDEKFCDKNMTYWFQIKLEKDV